MERTLKIRDIHTGIPDVANVGDVIVTRANVYYVRCSGWNKERGHWYNKVLFSKYLEEIQSDIMSGFDARERAVKAKEQRIENLLPEQVCYNRMIEAENRYQDLYLENNRLREKLYQIECLIEE